MRKQNKKQPKRTSRKSNQSENAERAALAPKNNLKSVAKPASKQTRLVAMLQSPSGATVDAMMKAVGWQQHSVRGFLAGVVRKRLKLNLNSTKIGERRVYRVTGSSGGESHPRSSKRIR